MTTSRWDTGLPSSDDLKEITRRARALPPESMSRGVKIFAGAATFIWLVAVVVTFFTLPERVPTHWSSDVPDGWSSRWGALGVELIGPVILNVVLAAVSRLVFFWPQGVNIPNKAYWLATPGRLNRLERIAREDMSLFAGIAMLLFAAITVITGIAARRPGGTLPEAVFALVIVAFIAAVLGVLITRVLGQRYSGQESPSI